MRSLRLFARLCAQRILPRVPLTEPSITNLGRSRFGRSYSTLRYGLLKNHTGRGHRAKGAVLLATANGVLGTAAFVKLSEKDDDSTEQTAEARMLRVSREELEKTVDKDKTGLSRWSQEVCIFLDVYIWEPLCTGFRFCHLVVIFVPVILAVPAMWIGRRQPGRDDERSGTLWWYNFLVWSMEAAGPAFIKVHRDRSLSRSYLPSCSIPLTLLPYM